MAVPAIVAVPSALVVIESPAGRPVADHLYGGTPQVAATEAWYGVPTMPCGSEDVVMFNAGGLIVSWYDLLAVVLAESFTVTLTLWF